MEALLTWRKAERIATTYGWAWLDAHVGADDRLRGGWSACDGAGGRMTAQNGLHNLPAPLRPAVAAAPGHVFVRADLGQIEPRVLAAVSGDAAFAAATRAPDLYAPVGAALGVDRPVAKVAVLAAMYGQTSGAAGEALKDLERAYPTAMGYLERAYDEGVAARAVHTYGGRRVPMWPTPADTAPGAARRRARPGTVRPQRRHPGRGGRAVQGVGRHRAPRDAGARRAHRAVPARRADPARARPRTRRRSRRRWTPRCWPHPGAGPAPTP